MGVLPGMPQWQSPWLGRGTGGQGMVMRRADPPPLPKPTHLLLQSPVMVRYGLLLSHFNTGT